LCGFIDFAQPQEGRKEEKKRREQLYRLFYQMENKRKTTKVSLQQHIFRPPPFSPNNTKAYKHSLRNPGSAIGIVFRFFFFFKDSHLPFCCSCAKMETPLTTLLAADNIQKMTSYSKESADCYDRYLSGKPFNRVFNASIV
jgi:hypothetical protein